MRSLRTWLPIASFALVLGVVGHQLWRQSRELNNLTALVHGISGQQEGDVGENDGDLMRRVQELESRVAKLQARVERREPYSQGLGDGSSAAAHSPSAYDSAIGAGDDDQSDDALSAVVEALESYNPEIRDRLRAVVQEEQDRLREERDQERRERWNQRTQERLTQLAREVDLAPGQLASLGEWLHRERDQVMEIFQQARRDHSFGEAGEKAQKIRDETNAEVKEMLDDDQFAAYQTMREEEDRRRFGFGRPPAQSPKTETQN